jgi:hypothetical protein
MASNHTGVSAALSGRDLAREVARQSLVAIRSARQRPPMLEAVRMGVGADLSVADMQKSTGTSRQTVYNAVDRLRDSSLLVQDVVPDSAALALPVLTTVVAADGSIPMAEVGDRLSCHPESAFQAARSLAARGLVELTDAVPTTGDRFATTFVSATPAADDVLRSYLDDLLFARVEGFGVYLALLPEEATALTPVLADVLGRYQDIVLEASVAPSRMAGPELALTVYAPTSRVAIATATDVWDELRDHAGLPPATARVAAVSEPAGAPHADSPVLDAFVQAITESAPHVADRVVRARMRFDGRIDERTLAGRCLTAAVRATVRAHGGDRDPRPITDGEMAWHEFEALAAVRFREPDADGERLKQTALAALDLGVERLGPLPGGRIGTGGAVESFTPSAHELVEMARRAGVAVGVAAAIAESVDAAAEVGRVGTTA